MFESNMQQREIGLIAEKNELYIQQFMKNPLMLLIKNEIMVKKNNRERLLDCIQIFSDAFQKAVMLRNIFCEDDKFLQVTIEHLNEEFGHNLSLLKDRNNRPAVWDAVLDSTTSWFVWKMFTLDNDEKTVLMHLVLESSANIFFQEAHRIMQKHDETKYFQMHSEADEKHASMGMELLKTPSVDKVKRLLLVQKQGWDVLNAACGRIAHLTSRFV